MKNLLDYKLLTHLDQLNDTDYTIDVLSGSMESGAMDTYEKSFEAEYQLEKIKDQKDTMMCVGYSHSYATEMLLGMNEPLSQYFIYHNRSLQSMDENPFPGYHNSAAEAHLLNDGVVLLRDYDNNQECPDGIMTLNKIKSSLLPKAAEHKISAYFAFKTVDQLKTFISTYKVPAIISIAVYESVAGTKEDGILPKCEGKLHGYHSMCVIGYDEKYLKVINSIGDEWGDKGYGYLDYTDTLLIQEMRGMIVTDNKTIVVNKPEKPTLLYRVQISANKVKEYAEENQTKLAQKLLTKEQQDLLGLQQNYLGSCLIYENELYKCQVGSFANKENAEKLLKVLIELGYTDAWITEFIKK